MAYPNNPSDIRLMMMGAELWSLKIINESMQFKTLSERPVHDYVVKKQVMSDSDIDADATAELAYTKDGYFIGDLDTAERLHKRGIIPEPIDQSHDTCSIGFCPKDGKWYGWSHRAICGYGIGDKYEFEEGQEEGPAKTLNQARQFAIKFADSVS